MGKFQSIQSLRFFAAALVFGLHWQSRMEGLSHRYGVAFPHIAFSGGLGVHIFFVISGFIMTWLTYERFGRPGVPMQFALDRITRIVPLYWIFTTIYVLLVILGVRFGDASQLIVPTLWQVLKSYLFVPYLNQAGNNFPVLGVGWTLNFEMMFYAILTGCLLLRPGAGLITLFVAFAAIFAAGRLPWAPEVLRIYSNPYIFEFLAGVLLALIRMRFGVLVPVRAHPLLLLVPIMVLTALHNTGESPWRVANIPVALVLVAFAVLGRDQGDDAISRAFAAMGDWSYSLYLLHELVLIAVGVAWHKTAGGHGLYLLAAVMILASIGLSWTSFTYLEKPITRRLRRLIGTRSVAGRAAVTA